MPPVVDKVTFVQFEASPDQTIYIGVRDAVLSAPFFRWDGSKWVDATGDYDLALIEDGTKLAFTNRRNCGTTFAYRFFSVAWLAKRLGF